MGGYLQFFKLDEHSESNMYSAMFSFWMPGWAQPGTLCKAFWCQFCLHWHNMWTVICGFAAYYHFSRMLACLVLTPRHRFPSALWCFFICLLVLIKPLDVSYDISPLSFISPYLILSYITGVLTQTHTYVQSISA